MPLSIPELSLVLLIGPSGAGKSTFARRHFKPTEVLSSDYFRGLVADDDTDQTVSAEAFATLHFVASQRLKLRKLTVIDATNVQPESRKPLVALAKEYHYLLVAIVFDLTPELCHARNQGRPDRQFGPHVVRGHHQLLKRSLPQFEREGFRIVYTLSSPEEVEAAVVERRPLWTDKREEHGPFDFIGDVHGCYDELLVLLSLLGYIPDPGNEYLYRHPEGRKLVFVGDLVDRGPKVVPVLRLVMTTMEAGHALCVMGNHDFKLLRHLRGNKVTVTHGLGQTIEQLEPEPGEFKERVRRFLDDLLSHYVLDDGKVVVAHAGLTEELQGRASGKVRSFAMYGDTTGETDEFGLPVRNNWAADYRGKAMVIYGHTPVPDPEWLNRTINLDTGCVFGGRLAALRYPEKELVTVPALAQYAEPKRPLVRSCDGLSAQQQHDDLLDHEDVSGRRIIATRLSGNLTIREEQGINALEALSRFAVDPHWLIYLPPTMSPCETSSTAGVLEHPAEAFTHYRNKGVTRVVCEEKHMGSRSVVIVCRDEESARQRFGLVEGGSGIVYTRTGRRFFDDTAREVECLACLRGALDASNFWERFQTTWVCLDCELLPWSAKAQQLLKEQYAAVGAAARAALPEVEQTLAQAAATGVEVETIATLRHRFQARQADAEAFAAAYRRYCWPVTSLADLRLAPFHLLATEGKVHCDQTNVWHMEQLAEVCKHAGGFLLATPFKIIETEDEASVAEGVRWWEELTARGGEGMVVKPFDFIARDARGLVQPAVKVRGREYLRIIYGPDYTQPEHLERLRQRGLSHKRSLAVREFALGIEALERFVQREPLRRVHECVFGVLALESEPVDPRL